MGNKRYLKYIICNLILLLSIMCFKSDIVLADSQWIQTTNGSTTGNYYKTTNDASITSDLTQAGTPSNTQDTVQAWHYNGSPENYWQITDMNVNHTFPTIYDSQISLLLTDYTTDYLTAYVQLPSNVLSYIASNGDDAIRAVITADNVSLLANKDIYYKVTGSYLEIQFKGILKNVGDFWHGKNGFITMPLPDSNYGENAFSMFDISSNTHLGGMYTQNNDTPFDYTNIYMANGGWGLLNDSSDYYKVYADGYATTYVKGSDMRISLGSLASGGAQAAVYYFPFAVQFYVKNPSGVTVKYVDEATGSDISTPDVFNNETPGSHTYNAKTISGYTLQGASSQTINVVSGQNYTVTFKYTKDPTTGSVTVRYVDKATGGDISAPDVYSSETPGSHTYNAKTFSGYSLIGANSQTIDVVAGQSYTVIFNYDKSKLPTCTLNAQPTAVVGDDVYLSAFGKTEDTNTTSLRTTIQLDSSPYIAGTNPIKGDLKTFDAGAGGNANANGTVFFTYPGTYTVRAYTIDSNGNMGEATPKQIVVTNPIPAVNIVQTGTLKENRKVIIDASSSYSGSQRSTINWDTGKWVITPLNGASMNDVRIQTHTTGSTDGAVLFDPSKGINKPLDGSKLFFICNLRKQENIKYNVL